MEKIKETNNYCLFTNFDWNRELNQSKITKIAESMNKFGWIGAPVYVNSDYRVWDGQHRIAAAEIVGIPVKYVITDTYEPEMVSIANSTASVWKLKDYVHFYAARGNKSYHLVEKLCIKYPFGAEKIIRALNKQRDFEAIKSGAFVATEEDFMRADAKLRKIMTLHDAFHNGFLNVKYTACLFIVENYDDDVVNELVKVIQNTRRDAINSEDTQTLMNCLEEIYNKRKKEHKRVYFGEDYKHSRVGKMVEVRRQKYNGRYHKTAPLFA